MLNDQTGIVDEVTYRMDRGREIDDEVAIKGWLEVEVHGPDGELKHRQVVDNLVTQVGEAFYALRGAGVGTIAAATGMQLGTGTTAPTKTGAASTIVTLIASSLVALATGFPSDGGVQGGRRRVVWQVVFGAGVATNTAIAEVVLTNQATGTQTAVPEANSLARALFSPAVSKASGDTLTVTWNQDIGTP